MGNYSQRGYLTGKANKNEMNISSSFDLALGNAALNLIALPTYYFTEDPIKPQSFAFCFSYPNQKHFCSSTSPSSHLLCVYVLWYSKERILSRLWFDFLISGEKILAADPFASDGVCGASLSNYFWHFAHQIVSFFKEMKNGRPPFKQ